MKRTDQGNGTGGLDIAATIQTFQDRAARLKELAKEDARLQKERERLNKEQAAFDAEYAAVMGNGTTAKPRQTRKVEGNRPRGNRGNNGNSTRVPVRDLLLKTLPDNTQDGITKDDIVDRLVKAGFTTKSDDPKIIVGQVLGRFRDFHAPERGKWRLTAHGVKARDQMIAEPAETKSEPVAESAKALETEATPAEPVGAGA